MFLLSVMQKEMTSNHEVFDFTSSNSRTEQIQGSCTLGRTIVKRSVIKLKTNGSVKNLSMSSADFDYEKDGMFCLFGQMIFLINNKFGYTRDRNVLSVLVCMV